jgi:S1-C subfamily serine protease
VKRSSPPPADDRYAPLVAVRPARLFLLLLLAAAVGGGAVLGVAALAGWVGDDDESPARVVVAPAPPAPVPARAAVPLSGKAFDAARIYAERSAGVVTIYAFFGDGAPNDDAPAAQGSGFVASPDGYILTSSHVITTAGETPSDDVRAASQVFVRFSDGDRVVGEVVGWDVFDDVALVKVDPKEHPLRPVPLGDSAAVVVGEPVAAIGSPFGKETSLAVGVVSATNRSIESLTSVYDLPGAIQTDAPINKGNSGGPLLDARGRVIGINAQIRSQSGNGEGVGFAVPINAAKRSMRQLIERGRVAYSYVGVTTEDLTPSIAREFGDPVERGAVIAHVRPDSPGARAGLRGRTAERFFRGESVSRGGDIVVAINGIAVRTADDLVRIIAERLRPGETAVFTVLRGGDRRDVRVVLGERPTRLPA